MGERGPCALVGQNALWNPALPAKTPPIVVTNKNQRTGEKCGLAMRAHNKGLEMVTHILPDVPDQLVGDALRLRQVLINFVGNAIKFTDTGEIVVRAELVEATEQDARLHFSVRDTGIGISPEKIETVFQAFEQADGSTTRQYGGTGLGLPISAQLIEMMNGRVWIESDVGQGTTLHFTIHVPIEQDEAAESDKIVQTELVGMRALVIEQNHTQQIVLCEMLCNWSIRPNAASSIAQATSLLAAAGKKGDAYQLVFVDSAMDEPLDQVLGMLRQATGPECRILVVSASPLGKTRADGVVLKPIQQSAMYNALLQATGLESLAGVQPAEEPQAETTRPLNILLAEDNAVNQRLANKLLEKMDHTVTTVGTGRQAVDAWMDNNYDLVLMDVQMPEMDGFEATAAIRQAELAHGQHQPIIAMTAHAMKGDKEDCLNAGMDGYVSKPIRGQVLREEIARVLNEAQVRESSTEPKDSEMTQPKLNDVIDQDDALDRLEGDSEMLQELLNLFLEEADAMKQSVHNALEARDAGLLCKAAHTVKGALANISATSARDAAFKVEQLAREDHMAQAAQAVRELDVQLERLCNALQTQAEGQSTCEF